MTAGVDLGSNVRLALFRGDDAYAIGRAIEQMAAALGDGGVPLERWSVDAADAGTSGERAGRLLDRIEERVGSAPLFGGGTLTIVRTPGALIRDKTVRQRLIRLLGQVPQGNGLALADLGTVPRAARGADPLGAAVSAAGGMVRHFPAPTRERMERWLEERAGELAIRLAPGAARLLAERVGAAVRENDIDRRGQTELANAELEKLALYRPGGTASREDVAALVPETIPGSSWALLDAIGRRRVGEAARLGERLMAAGTPIQLLTSLLHRRLRELLIVSEHLAAGSRPAEIVAALRVQPFRAERLTEQAATWSPTELERALSGLLEIDLASKGLGPEGHPGPVSDERSALAFDAWLAETVAVRRGAQLDQASSWRT